jgi:hypothetical protein
LGKKNDDWLKRQQRPTVSDITEEFISVTDIKQYIYCPRLIYFDHVLRQRELQQWKKLRH